MFENAIYREETLFPIGSRYIIDDEEYILARVAGDIDRRVFNSLDKD